MQMERHGGEGRSACSALHIALCELVRGGENETRGNPNRLREKSTEVTLKTASSAVETALTAALNNSTFLTRRCKDAFQHPGKSGFEVLAPKPVHKDRPLRL